MNVAALVDVVIAVLLVEAVALAVFGRRFRRLPSIWRLLPNLAAGLFLVLSLRSAVHAESTLRIASFLALAGVAHVLDMLSRARR